MSKDSKMTPFTRDAIKNYGSRYKPNRNIVDWEDKRQDKILEKLEDKKRQENRKKKRPGKKKRRRFKKNKGQD